MGYASCQDSYIQWMPDLTQELTAVRRQQLPKRGHQSQVGVKPGGSAAGAAPLPIPMAVGAGEPLPSVTAPCPRSSWPQQSRTEAGTSLGARRARHDTMPESCQQALGDGSVALPDPACSWRIRWCPGRAASPWEPLAFSRKDESGEDSVQSHGQKQRSLTLGL